MPATEHSTTASAQVKVHPAADAFPMMNAEQYQALKADIAENGQREDIVVWCGKLIDGRNRLRACEELGRQPSIAELDEEIDPVAYVISANLHRRHLTTGQRSMVAAKLATLTHGGDRKSGKIKGSNDPSISNAAKLLSVSEPSVKRAKQVAQRGSKELVQAVERGEVNLNQAVNVVKNVESKSEQAKIVSAGKDSIAAAAVPLPTPQAAAKEPTAKPAFDWKKWRKAADFVVAAGAPSPMKKQHIRYLLLSIPVLERWDYLYEAIEEAAAEIDARTPK